MSAATDFAMLQRLPPAGAIAYLQGRKDLTVTHSWQDLWHEEHARQFTISRLTRLDLLQAIRESLEKSVNGELTRADWMRDTRKLLQNAGWWGTKEVIDPATGKTVSTTFDNQRLSLIFDTNTRQAAAAGQWERVQATRKTHPFLRYITKDDERVRPAHRAWHNLTLPVDDAFWLMHWPPNGWRCRCRVVSMNRRDYAAGRAPDGSPLNTTAPPFETIAHINRRTGEITQTPVGVDPGFGYNAGVARQQALEAVEQAKLKAAAADLAAAARKEGLQPPQVAREKPDQPTWKTLDLPDLRELQPRAQAPELLAAAESIEDAVSLLRGTLGVPVGAARSVHTPVGDVTIMDELLRHVVDKRQNARERYANFVLPTLMRPDEVWRTAYDNGTTRKRFIKLFSGSKYDIIVIVEEMPDGDVLWNIINRERGKMNTMRIGELAYQAKE
ncbi:PBECR2 nuclease fold domain-containing protein [Comamonas sp. NLF-1-9]|uniref:phage minor head protein n=1 Tax=Comamonas sp. NLF-1-9 TaxID=2853163 RepID=UPI001C478623|nr:PBECR2 nuclease fold domain-containing protein [Comamonas sp. NLF-1-9]QXL84130.1 minor capsid protein [Comamonas sp. NLF-1-9]